MRSNKSNKEDNSAWRRMSLVCRLTVDAGLGGAERLRGNVQDELPQRSESRLRDLRPEDPP